MNDDRIQKQTCQQIICPSVLQQKRINLPVTVCIVIIDDCHNNIIKYAHDHVRQQNRTSIPPDIPPVHIGTFVYLNDFMLHDSSCNLKKSGKTISAFTDRYIHKTTAFRTNGIRLEMFTALHRIFQHLYFQNPVAFLIITILSAYVL